MHDEPQEHHGDPGDDPADPRTELRERTRRQLIAVAISAAVLVLAGAVTLLLLGDGDDNDDGSNGPAGTAGPRTSEPPARDGNDHPHPSGLDTRHPLVGRTEAEAREVYPLIRTEWVDGAAMMLTADLVVGRVGVAVEGGVVVAAGAEGCEELPADPAVWQEQACDPSPDDGATVWGQLVDRDGGLALEPGAGADQYYEFMQVVPFSAHPDFAAPDGRPVSVDLDGAPVDESELMAGQTVWLWITGGCEERYPVGCTVDALVLER